MRPLLAAIGIPDLAPALRVAGFTLLTDSTEPNDVAAAVRAHPSDGAAVFLIVAGADQDRIRSWCQLMVSTGRLVLLLGDVDPIEGARSLPLPCTVRDIVRTFGAPDSMILEPGGSATVSASGSVTPHRSPEPTAHDWDASHWESAATPEPAPVGPVHDPAPSTPAPVAVTVAHDAPVPAPVPVPRPAAYDPTSPGPVLPPRPAAYEPPAPAPVPRSPRIRDEDLDLPVPRGAIGTLAPVIIAWGARGGIGKSSSAMCLAERAVSVGGLGKVIVIDGNRGQGDVRKYLRLSRGNLPSLYDAAMQGDPAKAIIGPSYLAQARPEHLPDLGFGLVMAPREGQADPLVVTTRTYAEVVEAARRVAELVIIDTQILEDHDTSGLWDQVWEPMLASGSWGLGLSDSSTVGVTNLTARLLALSEKGVGPDRMLIALNRVPNESTLNRDAVVNRLTQFGTFAGLVHVNPEISTAFEQGRVPHDAPEMSRMLDEVLYRVTGRSVFEPGPDSRTARPRGSFLGRFGRRAS